jgi:septum formation protein
VVKPRQWATALAYLKAVGAARALVDLREPHGGKRTVVLGADTVVVKGDRLIGKAESAAEAREIIEALESGEHEVVTGVALLEMGLGGLRGETRRALFADGARVRVGPIGAEAIAKYVAGGGWRGKAGAYNLEERVQAGWPIAWTGDATTVMGLPMERLMPMLRAWGVGSTGGVGGEGAGEVGR